MKHFHGFRLDTINQCLWRGEERVSLTPKAFDLLRYLAEHADRLVTHDEILDALWTDTYVNQEVVKKYILGIRKVLGDQRDQPQFIRTIPKRGYQFVAPITDDRELSPGGAAVPAAPFVDRRTARAQLETYLSRVVRGTRQVVFVTGEAGVGKTTFVDLFVQRLGPSDARIARGQSIEGFGGQEAYYPVLEAVDQLVRRSEDERILQLLTRYAPTWLLQFPSLVKADQREALRRDTLGATRERMVREMCEMLEAIAGDRLLIVVLEDLHWADLATLDVVSTFARRREPARILFVATERPAAGILNTALSRLRQDLAIHGLCEQIPLEAFEPAEVSEYLGLEFGDTGFAADLAAAIHHHCGGNALFVSALVRDLVANGTVVHDSDGWKLTTPVQSVAPRVPASLQDMLNVQFDRLSDAEQRALRAASVVGEHFAAWLLSSETEPLDDVERVCEHLAERRLFIRPTGIDELPNGTISAHYEFRHALYRQAIYGRLSDAARSRLHRGAAHRLEALLGPEVSASAAEIAVHFEKARDHERAIQYLMIAAGNAARRFAVRDSLEVLLQAMSLVPALPPQRRPPLEIQIYERIGDAQYALGAMVESARAYETESDVAARAGLLTAHVQAQSCFARPLGLLNPDRAIAVLNEAAKASAAVADPIVHARVALFAAGARLLYDRWDANDVGVCEAADGVLRAAGETAAPGFDEMVYAHVQALRGNTVTALRAADSGLRGSNEAVGLMVHLFALSAQILSLLQVGRFGDALRVIRDSEEAARKNGSDPWLFLYREAWLRTLALEFAGAQRVCYELVGSSVYPTGQAQAIGQLAAGFQALDEGRLDEARRCFERVRDPAETPKFFLHWYWRLLSLVGLTHAWRQSGDLTKARHEASRLIEAALAAADPNLLALAWDARAQIAIAESHWNDARQAIDEAVTALQGIEAARVAWQVHSTAWDVHRRTGHVDTASAHRERARDQIAAIVASLPPTDSLREAFLRAPAVRSIREEEVELKL